MIDETIKRIDALPALSTSFLDGMTPEDLARKILGTDCKILEKDDVAFNCDCSKEKYAGILETLKSDQLEAMINEDHGAELTCNFCGNKYHYSEDELKDILAKKNKDKDY